MKVSLIVPAVLSKYCGGTNVITVSAARVDAALNQIERNFPRLYPNLCDETGALRRHLSMFVNDTRIQELQGQETTLQQGDEILILTAVSGG